MLNSKLFLTFALTGVTLAGVNPGLTITFFTNTDCTGDKPWVFAPTDYDQAKLIPAQVPQGMAIHSWKLSRPMYLNESMEFRQKNNAPAGKTDTSEGPKPAPPVPEKDVKEDMSQYGVVLIPNGVIINRTPDKDAERTTILPREHAEDGNNPLLADFERLDDDGFQLTKRGDGTGLCGQPLIKVDHTRERYSRAPDCFNVKGAANCISLIKTA